ncbi:nitroreductase family protein [Acidaminobacter hydrogenoformans]|uniref:Putative TM nitroreductase n=1 Tax=Acidaminobacter hydrogenoformans DSM 2784 TaxID=1120920 RepID=A0A1G5S7T7_9FIRM|nr:nitroreductase family protein [Acidaminobacter hydrogenoformans]SCZ81781.1 Putative TM nitroreductase [Acidaminobacter hydrogenoformans DSM 2784]
MINQQLYDTIFKRKSVRKYDMNPLSETILNEVKAFANSALPLVPELKYTYTYLSAGDIKNLLPIKAPHYLCLYSETKDHYLMNAGYLLQQIDLFLSERGLGSCWLGMAKPNKQVVAQQDGLEFVIMLAFGMPAEPVHRTSVGEFKRKPVEAITRMGGEVPELLEAVRLAPSASNSQPWIVGGTPSAITVSREKLNLIRGALYNKMNQIDIGIALLHLELAIRRQGGQPVYDFAAADGTTGGEFMAKVEVKPIDE